MNDERQNSACAPPGSTFTPSPENLIRLSLEPPARPGPVGNLGRYEILKLIGSGGMGVVLLGRDTATSRLVAIKMVKPELAVEPRAVHRFLKEARHMERLSHPRILPVLQISDCPPTPYFVMPYVERGSLATALHERRPLAQRRVLKIAREVAAAIAHAHSKGLIHRDLKPGNVLLDADEGAYLTDFGLARTLFNDSLIDVTVDHRAGTAPYMSPSVAAGEAEDTRCDIYSFGALLYETLTGRPPYEGETTQAILKLIQAGPPRPILELNRSASPALVTITQGAMARELRCRYTQMADVLLDLDRAANHEAPLAALNLPAAPSSRGAATRLSKAILAAMTATMILVVCLLAWVRRAPSAANETARLSVIRKLELPGVWQWSQAKVGHWQLEHEEMLFLPHDDRLLIVSGDGLMMHQWRAPDGDATAFTLDLLSDLDGDRLDDPVVSWRAGKTLHSAVLNYNLFPLKRFTAEGATRTGAAEETGTSGMRAMKVADLDGDGKRELLATVGTGYELKPRGLYCFDYETGDLLWRHDTGPYLTEVETIDLDHDGRLEVVAGSNAVDNGNRADDGTDDGHSYIYAFSSEGKVLWTKQLEGPFALTLPLVADLDGEGEDELLVWVTASHFYRQDQAKPEVGHILKLDAAGATVASYDAGARLLSCVFADLDGDGASDIIATDRHGNLHALNQDLTLRAKTNVTPRRYDVVELQIAAVADLDRDGHPEIILTSAQEEYVSGLNLGNPTGPPNVRVSHDICIFVLSRDLRPLARYVVAQTWRESPGFSALVTQLDGSGTSRILALSDKALLLEYEAGKK